MLSAEVRGVDCVLFFVLDRGEGEGGKSGEVGKTIATREPGTPTMLVIA